MGEFPDVWAPVGAWSDALKVAGKPHIPNPAAITAAAAEAVGWPVGAESILLIQPRMVVWTAMFVDIIDSSKPLLE